MGESRWLCEIYCGKAMEVRLLLLAVSDIILSLIAFELDVKPLSIF
jgi:hypothetical protein